jgi:hypothetical protein
MPTDDFCAMESRFYQVKPTYDMEAKCAELGIIATAYDENGALTAWQTPDGRMAATQFHPEALPEPIHAMLDNPPVGDEYCINVCEPWMRDVTRGRISQLPVMRKILNDFIIR